MRQLTRRERQIADLIVRGYRSKMIASELDITYGTVKLHLNHIYAKLGVSSRVLLAVEWVRQRQAEEIDWMGVAAE